MSLTIYDYDYKSFGRPYFYKKLKELECLVDMGDDFRFQLKGTNLYIYLTYSSFLWVLYPEGEDPKIINFEDVLEMVDGEIAEGLVYHIDIFKQERKIRKET